LILAEGTSVTILLPTFNREKMIAESIASILGQTWLPGEIIVIDDGSTDQTETVVRSFGSRVQYIRQDNGGKSSAINRGLALAKGNFILVMDDDDLLPPKAIERHLSALSQNPNADFSYGRFSRFRGACLNAACSTDVEPVPANDHRRLVIKLMERCYLTNPTWMVRTSAQRRSGPYNERLKRGQDFDMLLRLARHNEGVFIDDIVLWQRDHIAPRGHDGERVTTNVTINLWIRYNLLMIEQLDSEWSDEDFRPYTDSPDTQTRLAVLERATLMLVHRAYGRGTQHLDRYLRILGTDEPTTEELFAASYLLGNRHGIENLFVRHNALERIFENRNIPQSLQLAFAFELRWRLFRAVRRFWLRRLAHLAVFGIRVFGLRILAQLPFQNWNEQRRTRGITIRSAVTHAAIP
jgi:glycosyltransferase involved in cell wall biosynthesis